jgi:hypothetical protein
MGAGTRRRINIAPTAHLGDEKWKPVFTRLEISTWKAQLDITVVDGIAAGVTSSTKASPYL